MCESNVTHICSSLLIRSYVVAAGAESPTNLIHQFDPNAVTVNLSGPGTPSMVCLSKSRRAILFKYFSALHALMCILCNLLEQQSRVGLHVV